MQSWRGGGLVWELQGLLFTDGGVLLVSSGPDPELTGVGQLSVKWLG